MNRFIVTIIFLFSVLSLSAQKYSPYIKFEKNIINLGDIHEEKGMVKAMFKLTNTGSKPLIINEVKSPTKRIKACWMKKPVLPNKSAVITLSYSPKRMKGVFSRSLTVVSNAKNKITIIKLRGKVIPKPLTLKEEYPVIISQLRYKKGGNKMYFHNIKNTESKTDTLHFLNNSRNEVALSFRSLPPFIKVDFVPQTVKPGQKGQMVIEFDARKTKDYGYTYERLPLLINNKYDYKNDITINAVIEEDFSKLTKKQIADAPRIKFRDNRFNFGNLEQGKNVSHKYFFKNTGKSDLIIRKIKSGCGCAPYLASKRYIRPGEETFIEVTFKSKGRRGRQHKFITIISNDPVNSTVKLEIIGNITKSSK